MGFPTRVIYSLTSANRDLIECEVESKNNVGNSSFSVFGNGDSVGVRNEILMLELESDTSTPDPDPYDAFSETNFPPFKEGVGN